MLGVAVVLYLLTTISIGLYAANRVKGAKDFMVAGRSLPLYMNFACVFATWFGAETLLSVSATFTKDGLSGVSGDPFGAAVCLILVALVFAKHFYRMDLLTIGDYYHKRYGKGVEIFTSFAITLSYLGWTSAQMTALGLVLFVLGEDVLGPDRLTLNQAIIVGAVIVVIYTFYGGMWSVALTDLVQTAVIVVGLLLVTWLLADMAGGFNVVIDHAAKNNKFQLFPSGGSAEWWAFIGAFVTFAFGSIPQQDVFQRVTSAKDEPTAIRGTLFGGLFYFAFAFVPMFIAYSAVIIDPAGSMFDNSDERFIQKILPNLILNQTPLWTQVLFFGALLSAILSTASGALLAPSSLFTENVLRPLTRHLSDKQVLWTVRTVLLVFSIAAAIVAVNSEATMYKMVQNAYKVTLVGAFVPLAFGVLWKRATTQGAVFSIALGFGVWMPLEVIYWNADPSPVIPVQLYGLAASLLGMIVGSLLPQWIIAKRTPLDAEVEGEVRPKRSIIGH